MSSPPKWIELSTQYDKQLYLNLAELRIVSATEQERGTKIMYRIADVLHVLYVGDSFFNVMKRLGHPLFQ